jgi:hypothetical protein
MAVGVGFIVAAFFGIADPLPGQILEALRSAQTKSPQGWFVIIDGPPTGVTRGIQIGLLCVIVGAVPAAIVAATLARRGSHRHTSWSAGWGNVFLAGLIFQLGSLTLTAFLLALLLWAAIDIGADGRELLSVEASLLLSVVCGVWGLHSWRTLQFQVQEPPSTIAP